MTAISPTTGIDADGIAETEADHFMKCPGCGQWFDMRDLAQVFEHVHDGSAGAEPAARGLGQLSSRGTGLQRPQGTAHAALYGLGTVEHTQLEGTTALRTGLCDTRRTRKRPTTEAGSASRSILRALRYEQRRRVLMNPISHEDVRPQEPIWWLLQACPLSAMSRSS
jgi:hypothetical protein